MKEEEIDDLTTDQLRVELQKFGLNVVLMPSTIKIYKNKLKTLMSPKSNSEEEEVNEDEEEEVKEVNKDEEEKVKEVNKDEEEKVKEEDNIEKFFQQKTLSSCYYIVYNGVGNFKAPRMFHSQSLMKKFVTAHKARFSSFNSEDEAQNYLTKILNCPIVDSNKSVELTPTSKPTFSNLNQTNLNVLISAINKGDVDQFDKLVRQNPHYLWSSSNLPVILMPKPRYNSLHLAARAGQSNIITKIVETLQSDSFYEMLQFPKEQKTQFVNHILDAYFNAPDNSLHQTPLHFACSSGHVEAVQELVSYEFCKKNVKNKYGKTPEEVTRGDPSTAERIKFILREKFYIPLVRSSDNSSPAKVQKPVTSQSPLLKGHKAQAEGMAESPILSAIIGPFTEQEEALDTYKKWTSPDIKTLKENRKIVGSDFERGYERIGREVAKTKLVGWVEHWPFLDQFADLSKPSGLKLLNEYFTKKKLSCDRLEEGEGPTIHCNSKNVVKDKRSDVENNLEKDHNPTSELSSSFSHLGLGDAPKSKDQSKNFSLKDETCFYISGCNPTKLDLDVFLAIGQALVDPHLYPHVFQWQNIIKKFSSDEKKKWKTPRKPLKRNINSKMSPIPFLM